MRYALFSFLLFPLPFLPLTASAQSAEDYRNVRERLYEATQNNGASCTAARREIRRLRKKYPDIPFAFAARKAPTITGIRGCGYAWGPGDFKTDVETRALDRCNKIEARKGAGPCELMR